MNFEIGYLLLYKFRRGYITYRRIDSSENRIEKLEVRSKLKSSLQKITVHPFFGQMFRQRRCNRVKVPYLRGVYRTRYETTCCIQFPIVATSWATVNGKSPIVLRPCYLKLGRVFLRNEHRFMKRHIFDHQRFFGKEMASDRKPDLYISSTWKNNGIPQSMVVEKRQAMQIEFRTPCRQRVLCTNPEQWMIGVSKSCFSRCVGFQPTNVSCKRIRWQPDGFSRTDVQRLPIEWKPFDVQLR